MKWLLENQLQVTQQQQGQAQLVQQITIQQQQLMRKLVDQHQTQQDWLMQQMVWLLRCRWPSPLDLMVANLGVLLANLPG